MTDLEGIAEDVRIDASRKLSEALTAARTAVTMRVTILTRDRLVRQSDIRESLIEVCADRPGCRFEVRFEERNDLTEPFRIDVVPAAQARQAERERDLEEGLRYRLFTLSWQDLQFHDLLVEGAGWVPLGRSRLAGGEFGIELPDSLNTVPRDSLLELRCESAGLRVRRTWVRPEIAVEVGGAVLSPGDAGGRAIAPDGEITYAEPNGRGTTALAYRLTEWQDGVLEPGGVPQLTGEEPFEVWLRYFGAWRHFQVAPPEAAPEQREFPVRGALRKVTVEVEYTTATSPQEPEARWHVKIYRCATPQQARLLRRELQAQVTLIDRVNAAVGGGSARAAAWPIVPVAVVPEDWESLAAETSPTSYHAGRTSVVDNPVNRLSAWFGVPNSPRTDCYVLVVSPLLQTKPWAKSTDPSRRVPGIEELPPLRRLAEGLDRCHAARIVHVDIKPQNVGWLQTVDGTPAYVLLDGDSVRSLDELSLDSGPRATYSYAHPDVKLWMWEQVSRTGPVADSGATRPLTPGGHEQRYPGPELPDLVAHDRFGFALVVLCAIAGIDRLHRLLPSMESATGLIDDGEATAAEILGYWPEPRWRAFAEELAEPFRTGAFGSGDHWATEWIDRLLRAESDHGGGTGPPDVRPRAGGKYGHRVDAVWDEVTQHGRFTPAEPAATVVEALARHRRAVAVRAFAQTVVPVGLVLVVLAALVVLVERS
ncbi:hypothetical protein ACWED2_42520 [Amycolatopsis sp. NPDC005003]